MTSPLDPAGLLRQLHSAGVEHVLIGGLAVNAYGVIRSTKDVDICPSPEPGNLARLADLLRRLGVRQLGVSDDGFAPDELPFDPTRADDLGEGIEIRVCSLSALQVMKHAAGRPQDLQDLADLEIAHPEGD